MTQSPSDKIPTGISLEALQSLHTSAKSEESLQANVNETYQAKIERLSFEIVDDLGTKCIDQMVPKLVVLRMLNQMISWALENQSEAEKHNDLPTYANFTSMAAQLAAAQTTVINCWMGHEDFTHPMNESDDDTEEAAH